jgi:hypothetical protein
MDAKARIPKPRRRNSREEAQKAQKEKKNLTQSAKKDGRTAAPKFSGVK